MFVCLQSLGNKGTSSKIIKLFHRSLKQVVNLSCYLKNHLNQRGSFEKLTPKQNIKKKFLIDFGSGYFVGRDEKGCLPSTEKKAAVDVNR